MENQRNNCPYKIANFSGCSCITVFGRGESLKYIQDAGKVNNCYITGNLRCALNKLKKVFLNKNIVQILNKCDIQTHHKTCVNFNIKDIQCNFDGWLNREISDARKNIYKNIVRLNPWCSVHLSPKGIRERRPKNEQGEYIGWITTGLFALDLACFWKPKEIKIVGMDFYYTDYFVREKKAEERREVNYERSQEMIENFYAIINRDKNINFKIITMCKDIKARKNLQVIYREI